MSLKNDIKHAIGYNTKYIAVKVYPFKIEDSGLLGGENSVMTIEIDIRKKKKK